MLASDLFKGARRRLEALPRDAYRTSAVLAFVVAGATALPLLLPRAAAGIPVFWLANAVLLVAVLRARPQSRNRFLLVGFLADAAARLVCGDPFPGGAAHASFNVLEVAGAAMLVHRRRGVDGSARGGNKLAEITFWSAAVAPAIGAALLTAYLAATNPGHAGANWLTLYLRDGFGMVAIVPFGIALEFEMFVAIFRRNAVAQTLTILGALVGVDWFVFGTELFPHLFVIFPLLLLAAFRLGAAGAALSILLTAGVAAATMASGHGPQMLSDRTPIERLFGLQLFLTIGAWTLLPIVEVLRDREALLAQLRERWAELAESYGALEERNARVVDQIALRESIAAALPSRRAVIDVILTFAQEQTHAVAAVMERVSGEDLVYEVATGTLVGAIGASVKRAGSLSGLCSSTNEVLSCVDTELDARVDKLACRRLNIRSMIVVPIAIDGSVFGVLKVASDRLNAFGAHDVLNLKLAAGHLSSAMRTASSYERMELAEAEAQATIDNLSDAVVVFAADGTVLRHNVAAQHVLRLTQRQVETWGSQEAYVVDVDENVLAYADRPVGRALRTGVAQRDVVIGLGAAGPNRRWVAETVTPVAAGGDSRPERFILSARDITELQQSELEHRDYARQLSSLHLIASKMTNVGKEQVDAALALCREELEMDWGYIGVLDEATSELVIESSVGVARQSGPQMVGARLPLEQTLIGPALGSPDVLAVSDLADVDGVPILHNGRWGAYIAVPIRVSERVYGAIGFTSRLPRESGFLASERDFVRITGDLIGSAIERRLQRERLNTLAHRDALTGLPNRLVFDDRLAQTVLVAKRYREKFAVLFIDLDGFKEINDTYGHGAGDQVLQTVARRLEAVVRESDTVARIGGDEFLILAPKVNSWSDASDLAWRVVAAMREPISINGIPCTISASVGASVYPEDGSDAETMIGRADAALYRAKVAGKDSVGFARELTLTP